MRQRNGVTGPAPASLIPPQAAADRGHDLLRGLLARKEPDFARALAIVERELELQTCGCPPTARSGTSPAERAMVRVAPRSVR
jgi:hypothetical protein